MRKTDKKRQNTSVFLMFLPKTVRMPQKTQIGVVVKYRKIYCNLKSFVL